MRINLAGFALVGLLSVTSVAGAASFDVFQDFAGPVMPDMWKYGYAPSGAAATLTTDLVLHPNYTANCINDSGNQANCWGGVSSSAANPNGNFGFGTTNFLTGYLNLHPGANLALSVVAFIAPTAANYTFTGEFRDHDTVSGSGVDLYIVRQSGSFELATTLPTHSFAPVGINFTRALAANEAVYFAVGANSDYTYDSVGLKLQVTDDLAGVPEPSTWALTGLGAVAAVVARRRSSKQ